MLIINLSNVEKLVFHDKDLQKLLPEFSNSFKDWSLGKQNTKLKKSCQKSICDFLNNFEDIEILSNYFKDEVVLHKFDSNITRNCSSPLNTSEAFLNSINSFVDNFAISRDKSRLYISFFR